MTEKHRRSLLPCFLFPLNLSGLLAHDTGHLQIPVIHEDVRRHLNLKEISAGGILTRTAFGGTLCLFPQCCQFVTGPYIYTHLDSRSQPNYSEQRKVFTLYIQSTS